MPGGFDAAPGGRWTLSIKACPLLVWNTVSYVLSSDRDVFSSFYDMGKNGKSASSEDILALQ